MIGELVAHRPSDGCLCWGGPKHGEVVVIPDDRPVYLFAIPQRLSWRFIDHDDPPTMGTAFPTVRYDRQEFGMRWSERHGERWPVLIYGDGRDRLMKHLEVTANFLRWLCHPFEPTP